MRKIVLSILLISLLIVTLFSSILTAHPDPVNAVTFDTGDTAWMIVATALVLIMTRV
jgi:Amt family ammonium transporter